MSQDGVLIRSWSSGRIYEETGNEASLLFSFHSNCHIVDSLDHSCSRHESEERSLDIIYSSDTSYSTYGDASFDSSDESDISIVPSQRDVLSTSSTKSGNSAEDERLDKALPCSSYVSNDKPLDQTQNLELAFTKPVSIASVKHRRWLSKVENTIKLNEQAGEEVLSRKQQRDIKIRNKWVTKAQNKGKGGYASTTFKAAKRNDTCARKRGSDVESAPEEFLLEEQEKRRQVGKQRRHHKRKYKCYLKRLKFQRDTEIMVAEKEIVNAIAKREKIADQVLSMMRRKRKDETKYDANNGDGDEKEECLRLKEKCKADIAAIGRHQKNSLTDADILNMNVEKVDPELRTKYEGHLHSYGPKGGHNQEGSTHLVLPETQYEILSEGTQIKAPNLVLRPSEVHAMALRLSTYRRDDKVFDLANTDYERWRNNAGIKGGQKIFCMTGWYPSVK